MHQKIINETMSFVKRDRYRISIVLIDDMTSDVDTLGGIQAVLYRHGHFTRYPKLHPNPTQKPEPKSEPK